jgi:hypothetical protein
VSLHGQPFVFRPQADWCQPARSQMTTAIELGAICVLISFRCSFIPSVLAAGMIMAAPTPLAGQMAPKRIRHQYQCWVWATTMDRGRHGLRAAD